MADLFAERLKQLREEQRMRQVDLAEALGVVSTTVSAWERGARKPDFATLDDLADRFAVSLQYLLGQTDERRRPQPPSEEELAEWANEEECDQLTHMASLMAQLSNEGREIVMSTLNSVYKVDRRRGTLRPDGDFEISIKRVRDYDSDLR